MSGSTEEKRHLLGGRFLRSAFHDQLTARGANVAATALAHRNRQMPVGQNLRESIDSRVRRSFERNSWRGVERDQIDLGLDAGQQLRESTRVLRRVVHSVEKHVLESDAAPSLSGNRRHASRMAASDVLGIGRHQRGSLLFGRRMKRDRQVRHQRLPSQAIEAGDDSDSRERDASR